MSLETASRSEVELEKWSEAEKLERFGFPAAKYLRKDGTLDEDRYLTENFEVVKDEVGPDYHIGELKISKELKEADYTGVLMGDWIGDYGLGHRRVADPPFKLARVLEIPSERLDVAKVHKDEKNTVGRYILAAFRERYLIISHEEGYRNGTAHKAIVMPKSETHPLVNIALDIWKTVDYQGYHNVILGKPSDKFTPEKAAGLIQFMDHTFGKGLRDEMKQKGVTHNLIPWPFISVMGFEGPTLLWGTDSVLDPRGWQSKYPTLVEMKLAKDRFSQVLGPEGGEKVFYLNGFSAQLGGLVRLHELLDRRSMEVQKEDGLPMTLVLTASGAATVQKRFFVDTMIELGPMVAEGKMRLVIQAGAEDFGRQVFEALTETAEEIEKEHEGFLDNIVLHYAAEPQGAVDFGEVLSSGECPMAFFGKGGEWTRMLLQLAIPHVVPVAIGDQECWNIITASMQDTCIQILPKAHEQVSLFIENYPGFPEELKRPARLAVDRHRAQDLTEAIHNAAWAIAEQRTEAQTNRQAMPEALGWLMTQPSRV